MFQRRAPMAALAAVGVLRCANEGGDTVTSSSRSVMKCRGSGFGPGLVPLVLARLAGTGKPMNGPGTHLMSYGGSGELVAYPSGFQSRQRGFPRGTARGLELPAAGSPCPEAPHRLAAVICTRRLRQGRDDTWRQAHGSDPVAVRQLSPDRPLSRSIQLPVLLSAFPVPPRPSPQDRADAGG
jgi:hypothetical protein